MFCFAAFTFLFLLYWIPHLNMNLIQHLILINLFGFMILEFFILLGEFGNKSCGAFHCNSLGDSFGWPGTFTNGPSNRMLASRSSNGIGSGLDCVSRQNFWICIEVWILWIVVLHFYSTEFCWLIDPLKLEGAILSRRNSLEKTTGWTPLFIFSILWYWKER